MNYQEIKQSTVWESIKEIFKEEIDDKPLNIKTDGMTAEMIALEVRASQLAVTKIKKVISKIDRLGNVMSVVNESWK